MEITNKVALVTGGSSGLGLGIAQKLLQEGATVYICGRSQDSLDKAKLQLNSDKLITIVCDVANPEQVEKMAKQIDNLDILVNNAGAWLEGALETNEYDKIAGVLDSNLKGLIYVTKAFLGKMKEKNSGMIINIASRLGIIPREFASVYSASKFGVRGFTDSLKLELLKTKLKIIGFYPGRMFTQLFEKAGFHKEGLEGTLNPQDVAETIVFIIKRPDNMTIDHIVINKYD